MNVKTDSVKNKRMAVDTILNRMVRKVTSADVLLDQRPDIKENKGPQGLVLQMVTELLKQTVYTVLSPRVTNSYKYMENH